MNRALMGQSGQAIGGGRGARESLRSGVSPGVGTSPVDYEDAQALQAFHSDIRWRKGKALLLLNAGRASSNSELPRLRRLVVTQDTLTGNQALHVAAQNGHVDLINAILRVPEVEVN